MTTAPGMDITRLEEAFTYYKSFPDQESQGAAGVLCALIGACKAGHALAMLENLQDFSLRMIADIKQRMAAEQETVQ